MECRAYAIRMDSQSGEHLGKDRKVSSAAGGNLSGMHKTEKTVKESRMNYMYSHLCDGTLAINRSQRTDNIWACLRRFENMHFPMQERVARGGVSTQGFESPYLHSLDLEGLR